MERSKATTCFICGVFLFNAVLHVCNYDTKGELKVKFVPQLSNVLLSTGTASGDAYSDFSRLTRYSSIDKYVYEIKAPIVPLVVEEDALRKGVPREQAI